MKKLSVNRLGIRLLIINAFIYIPSSQYAPFLSAYFTRVGINATKIGILLTIGPVVSILIQPIWAVISDRTGRRRDVLSLSILGSAVFILSYYIGHSFASFFLAAFLLSAFTTPIVPLNDAITLRIADKKQLDFSKIRMGGTVGYAIMVIIAGKIIRHNAALAYAMGSACYFILFSLVRRLPKEETEDTPPAVMNGQPKLHKQKKRSAFHIFKSNQICFILAFAFIIQAGLSFNNSFLGVYMLKIGLSESTIGIVNSISAISELPVLFLINHIIKRISTTKISFLACLLLGLRFIAVTGGSLPFIAASQALQGLTFMTIYFSCAVFISKNVEPENQSKGQSILAIIQTGAGSLVGNIIGGRLVDFYGLKRAYFIMALAVVTVGGLILLLQYLFLRKQKPPGLS